MSDFVIRAAVITVSDTRHLETDLSGDMLVELLSVLGAEIVERMVVSDDFEHLRNTLLALAAREDLNLVITTGGTGFAPRDNTPEATRAVIEREAPGLSEAMRRETASKSPLSMLSRGVCGVRDKTLLINLPGSPKAVEECFAVIKPALSHALKITSGHTEH